MSRYQGRVPLGKLPTSRQNIPRSGDKMETTDVSINVFQPLASQYYKGRKATRVMMVPPQEQKFPELLNEKRLRIVNGRPYLIVQKVGQGGSSKVYKVLAPDMAIYALKEVYVSSVPEYVVQSFENEIALLKKLQSEDRIIKLIDSEIDRQNGTISIVLELGDIDLASLISKNRNHLEQIDPNFLRLMWHQMLEAVQSVHQAKVIHGDLKPANFLFVSGTLKLIDFGIAMSIAPDRDTTSMERDQSLGTVNYMPPESLMARPIAGTHDKKIKQGRPADVWSLGCILYQLVYNRPPFPQNGVVEKIAAICDESYHIDFPFEDRPDFLNLRDVMMKCLQRNPKLRPTITELLDHPYLTMRPVDIEQDLLQFVTEVQDRFLDFDFGSAEGTRRLKRVKEQLLNGDEVTLCDENDDFGDEEFYDDECEI